MFEIKPELLQAILNYLVNQPYVQVSGLISEIQQCKPVNESTPVVKDVLDS